MPVILKEITDTLLRQHLTEISRDGIDLFLLNRASLRLACIHGTALANHARVNHGLGALEGSVLAEALLATALCGTNLKENESLGLLLESDGPAGGFVTGVNPAGHLRGYLRHAGTTTTGVPDPETPEAAASELLGAGSFELLRSDNQRAHTSRGHVDWHAESVSRNVERYFEYSEQTPTAVRIDTCFDTEGRLMGAAGILVQRMPGTGSGAFESAREALGTPESIAGLFSEGHTAPEIVREVFHAAHPELVSTRNAEFFCACSRERFARFLGALPAAEADDILTNGPIPLVTICHNCSSQYTFSREALRHILNTGT